MDLEICGFASRGERAIERPAGRSLAEIAPSPLAGQTMPCNGSRRVGCSCWIVIREGGMSVLVIGPRPREMPIASQRCLWPLS